jgi:hypothetical protein
MLAARVFITIILPQLAPLVMYVFWGLYSCNFCTGFSTSSTKAAAIGASFALRADRRGRHLPLD